MSRTENSPKESSSGGSPWRDRGGPLLLLLATAVGAVWSWNAWPDPIVDFGRELYVPWRLAEGDVLYRDIQSFNGPLSPYLIAGWFELVGVSWRNLALLNLFIVAAVALLVYRIIRLLATPVTATLAGLTFLAVFAFAQLDKIGNYNWVSPYSHELTHGIALALLSLYLLYCYGQTQQRRYLIGSGLLLGLVFLTKAEVFLAALIGLGAGLVPLSLHRPSRKGSRLMPYLLMGASALLPLLASLALLRTALPLDTALIGTLGTWVHVFNAEHADLPFFKWSMGTNDAGGNLLTSFKWLGYYFVVFSIPLAAAKIERFRGAVFPVLLFLLVAGSLIVATVPFGIVEWRSLPRPWLILLSAAWAGAAAKILRQTDPPPDRAATALRFGLISFALALLAKILLKVRVWHYGFALAMPAAVVIVLLLWHDLPVLIRRRGGHGALFRGAVLGAWLAAALFHVGLTESYFRAKTFTVGEGADAFRGDRRGKALEEARQVLERLAAPGETLVVVPEGIMLNYQRRMINPTPYIAFTPPLGLLYGESTMTRAVADSEPDWVVKVGRDTPEYGARFFGQDYHRELDGWISANYERVHQIGKYPYGIWIGKRSEPPHPAPLEVPPGGPAL